MLKAWTGEPFEYKGETVQITPPPYTDPHPMFFVGGSGRKAVERAMKADTLGYTLALGLPSLNSLTDLSLKLTDGTGSGSDVMRIRIRRASDGQLLGTPAVEPSAAASDRRTPKQGATA